MSCFLTSTSDCEVGFATHHQRGVEHICYMLRSLHGENFLKNKRSEWPKDSAVGGNRKTFLAEILCQQDNLFAGDFPWQSKHAYAMGYILAREPTE